MSLYRVGRIWYVDITVGDLPRFRKSARTDDRVAAQEWHDQKRAEFWRQARLGESPALQATWDAAAELWIDDRPRGQEDLYRLRWLTGKLTGKSLPALTVDLLERILKPKATSPGSYNRYVTLVLAILGRAKRRGWLEGLPDLKRRKEPRGRIRWLTGTEWRRLQKKLPPYLEQMARFALATGLRENNVLNLEWSQVDLGRKVAWIHADQAKAGEAIAIPLNTEAEAVLLERQGLDPTWVFALDGVPIYKASNRQWYRAVKAAGLEGFRWHDLRHTWASWHVMAGTPLEVLQKLGGWKTLQMVMRYAHLAPGHLAKYAGNVTSGTQLRQSSGRKVTHETKRRIA